MIEVKKTATLTGHKDCIYALCNVPSSSKFYSAGADGMVVEWDTEKPELGKLIATIPNSVYSLLYLQEGNQLVVGQNFEGIHLIDIQQRKQLKSLQLTSSYIFDLKQIDQEALIACGNGELIFLDLLQFTINHKIILSDKSLRAIAIDPTKKYIALGYSDHYIRILDLKKKLIVFQFVAHQNSIFTLTFSPDGHYLISGSRDAHLKVWNVLDNFQLHKSVVAHMFAINELSYTSDGEYLASCSMDKSIKLWDGKNFRLLKVLDKARHAGHSTSVNKIIWKGSQLISASDDRSISLWDIKF